MAVATHTAPTFPPIAALAADGRAEMIRLVDGEIAALKGELAILQDTRRALSGKNGTGAAAASTPRAGNGHRTAVRRRSDPARPARTTGRQVTEEMVLAAISPGTCDQSPKIAKALGAAPETVLRRLRALEASGQVRREGERASTRWVLAGFGSDRTHSAAD